MHKECEMAERKASRIKHCDVQKEYKPFFSGISDAFVQRFCIAPRMIKNALSHPLTSSNGAFDGNFASATGSILFHRSLFAQFGCNFDLKQLLESTQECIRKGLHLRISIYDPSRPDSEPIKTFTLFSQKETIRSREFKKVIDELREKTQNHN